MTDHNEESIGRRKLVGALGAGAVALGTIAGTREAAAAESRWQPALEKQDDWMEMPSRHRFVFDTTSTDGVGEALFFTRNYLAVNESAYGVPASELATIIIVRHRSTVFGYADSMWEKYGETFSKITTFLDPKTQKPPTSNLFDAKGYGPALPNFGARISDLAAKGVHFAVCGAATRRVAGEVAHATKRSEDEIHAELVAHLVPNGRIVPAGIVALNRAQERGYAVSQPG